MTGRPAAVRARAIASKRSQSRAARNQWPRRLRSKWLALGLLVLFLWAMAHLLASSYSPFLYWQF